MHDEEAEASPEKVRCPNRATWRCARTKRTWCDAHTPMKSSPRVRDGVRPYVGYAQCIREEPA